MVAPASSGTGPSLSTAQVTQMSDPGPGSGRKATAVPRTALTAAFVRTFAIQGSWNYRTLLGAGLAHAMLPLMKWIYAGDPVGLRESLRRHASSFNGHPYLCGMAVSALARLELEGLDPERIDRFRTALCSPLGALGDRSIWAGWRPFCLLAAVGGHLAGLSAWASVALFLVVYNVGHLWVRIWAFREGWRKGFRVGEALAGFPASRWVVGLSMWNVVLVGMVVTGLAMELPGTGLSTLSVAGIAGGSVVVAFLMPAMSGTVSVVLLLGAVGAWLF